mgnify:CR=1 FL=1
MDYFVVKSSFVLAGVAVTTVLRHSWPGWCRQTGRRSCRLSLPPCQIPPSPAPVRRRSGPASTILVTTPPLPSPFFSSSSPCLLSAHEPWIRPRSRAPAFLVVIAPERPHHHLAPTSPCLIAVRPPATVPASAAALPRFPSASPFSYLSNLSLSAMDGHGAPPDAKPPLACP